ncbi:3'-5' exonuclease [Pseudothermotoga thermarum]|uniref:DNA polymerase III, epsilon subunit n=1 Tax=Pseudothermotoga thermarum DSM 5069 TaxID=688269 RepID=F7YYL3_9THEM|nr:3'-5' exonuclease [Pseudothermotoga thermarum]AEH51045.1 DNA polymerase III, epsilon subunit [Pseudothermotoga thermarum DSM 5069]
MNDFLEKNLFCAMDTETTGTDPLGGDRIIEVAVVPIFKGKILRRSIYHSLVNPNVKIPATIQKIHKISNEDIQDAPEIDHVFEQLRIFLNRSIIVFHRAYFDLSFLDISAKEIGMLPPTVTYIDTQEMAKMVFGEKKSLAWLAEKFKLPKPTHRALDDAMITAKVFLNLAKFLSKAQFEDLIRVWRGSEW